MVDLLKSIIEKDPKNYSKTIKANADLLGYVQSHSSQLDDSFYSLADRVFWVVSGMTQAPTCKVCGKQLYKHIVSIQEGFPQTCSKECRYKNKARSEKRKQTCLKKYGVENPYQSDEIKTKIRKTNLDRYGKESYTQTQEYKTKVKYINRSKSEETRLLTLKKKRYAQLQSNEFAKPLFSLNEFLSEENYNDKHWKWQCLRCGKVFEDSLDNNTYRDYRTYVRCPHCLPILSGTSNAENELVEFVKSLGVDVVENDRTLIAPKEIDILIPSKKLAIEYDGLFWHSTFKTIDPKLHLNKTLRCKEKGYQLIHIFEDEWLYKGDIVKSRLKNLLGIYDKTVYARQCEVKLVSSADAIKFEEATHIQGSVSAKINYGLYFDNRLIALMTFGKPRYNCAYQYELLRFCTAIGYHIPGAASRLFKHFLIDYKPESVISYADLRWSQGRVYEALGFELVDRSDPNYFYTKGQIRESRIKYQKKNLNKYFSNVDLKKTEEQIMLEHKYYRIYDCGNLVYGYRPR